MSIKRKPSLEEFITAASQEDIFNDSEKEETFAVEVGRNLKKEREAYQKRTGVKQFEVATTLNMLNTTLCHYEAGRRVPSLRHFKNMCKLYDANPMDILNMDKDRYPGGKTIHHFIEGEEDINTQENQFVGEEINFIGSKEQLNPV